ncbi:MAG: hypothetical protein QOD75_2631 [Blastocatellia bacterium]|jgi:hypothetical protein|nr:hypothetical protein [Blastocatellia bacterium]
MSEKNSRRSLKDLAWGLGLLTFGCLATFGGWTDYRRDLSIERSGQRAEGHLKRKTFLHIYDTAVDYYIDYWFTSPGGERIEENRKISESLWDKMREGGSFTVMYSPTDPRQNYPQGESKASIWTLILMGVCAIVALSGVYAIAFFLHPQMFE